MQWKSHPDMDGICAVGRRGCYTISRLGPDWYLEGEGHDEIQFCGLQGGKRFSEQSAARKHAERIDTEEMEAQVSGE